jgi:hypothetical protein
MTSKFESFKSFLYSIKVHYGHPQPIFNTHFHPINETTFFIKNQYHDISAIQDGQMIDKIKAKLIEIEPWTVLGSFSQIIVFKVQTHMIQLDEQLPENNEMIHLINQKMMKDDPTKGIYFSGAKTSDP